MLRERGRLVLPLPVQKWRSDLLGTGIEECPVNGEIAILAAELESLHRDPAGRFIAATAISLGAILVTADERLLSWHHRLNRLDART